MKSSDTSPLLFRYLVRITGVPKPGSGILYFPPNNTDTAYVFTARHCVEGAGKAEIRIESISPHDGEITCSYVLLDDENHLVLYPEEPKKDLAVIIVPRNNIRAITGELPPLRLLVERFSFEQCQCIGFPAANMRELKTLTGNFRSFQSAYPWRFEANIAREENLETLESDSYAAVRGMSGGGVFFRYKDQFFLFGVMAEFRSVYKDFECVSLQTASELLDANGLPALPFTYGSPYGLSQDWFDRHIGQSIIDLGDRYTQELPSFDLPVGQLFVGIERGPSFVEKVRAAYHQFLQDLNENERYLGPEFLQPIRQQIADQLSFFRDHFYHTDWLAGGVQADAIPVRRLEGFLAELEKASSLLDEEVLKSYEERKRENKEKEHYYSSPFERECRHLWKIQEASKEFLRFMTGKLFQLALSPVLLVTGKAGFGKSHLLGDIAKKRWENGLPTILILGNKLISRIPPWEQILKEIGFEGSKEMFLTILDWIGQHLGERVLIMIDALNEGEGKFFWKDYLPGFIQEISRYPYLGLVLSVRSTYLSSIVPKHMLNDKQILQHEHQGFAGMELSAVKHFARYFNLEEPQIPLLSPEFSNPQFLLLLCRSLHSRGLTRIPDGLNGITSVYELFTEAINRKLTESQGYYHTSAFNLVKNALGFFYEKFMESGKSKCTHQQGLDIFAAYNRCRDGQQLFFDLIREGVFSEEHTYDFDEKEYIEVVRFTFERFGHHIQVGSVLSKFCKEGHPRILFEGNGFYAQQYQKYNYLDEGILEALAVQLPEKYGVELFEVIPAEFGGEDWKQKRIDEDVAGAFVESLLWRKMESIDFAKCREYINTVVLESRYSDDFFFSTILSLAPLPGHPFNADALHRMLINISMQQRDSYWSPQVCYHFSEESSPVSRLVEWFLSQDSLPELSREATRLSALTLGWFLTTSHQPLRDAATLALVKLLDKNIDTLITTLKAFEAADDPYVQERLFAVAYGCAMRTRDQAGLAELAQYVYDRIFKKGDPPAHILLREYAQGVVEVALYRKLIVDVSPEKARPPYSSALPDRYPTEEEVAKYKIPYESPEYKKNKDAFSAQNTISSSVLGSGDFKHYVIDRTINFYWGIKESTNRDDSRLDAEEIARWILQRVFEFGWSAELHGVFDYANNYNDREHHRYGGRTERIGKKYQWIALHEILARLADNYLIKQSWSDKEKLYEGTWKDIGFIRNIDPSLPIAYIRKEAGDMHNKDNQAYNSWHLEDWAERSDDLPAFQHVLAHKDNSGREWIALQRFEKWMAPEELGARKFSNSYREIWFQFRGYLVSKRDFPKCFEWLTEQSFMGLWMPNEQGHYRLFHEEFYWSPAYQACEKEAILDGHQLWDQFKGSDFKGIVPVEEFSAGGGGYPIQDGIRFLKPCAYLVREMGLHSGEKPGFMVDDDDHPVCYDDPLSPGIKLFICKDRLLEFLSNKDLVLCWTLLGEKSCKLDQPYNQYQQLEINGAYYLTPDGQIEGNIRADSEDRENSLLP